MKSQKTISESQMDKLKSLINGENRGVETTVITDSLHRFSIVDYYLFFMKIF